MTAYYYNVKDYGALGNGADDDTAQIQAALDDAVATGGLVIFPPGRYMVTNLSVNMPASDFRGIQLRGANYANCIIQRIDENPAHAGPILNITAHSVQMSDLKFYDYIPANPLQQPTNHWVLVQYSARNDFDVDRCWFGTGYIPMKCGSDQESGDQARFNGCIFEAGRRHGLYLHGFHNVRVIGNVFFRHGLYIEGDEPDKAALRIEGIPDHAPASNFTITGNYFLHSQYAHQIGTKLARAVTITGNFFCLAGIYDEGGFDDINLTSTDRVTIASNVSVQAFDPLPDPPPAPPNNLVNRRIITIAEDCRNVQIGENSFEPGIHGVIRDLAPDTSITPQTIRRSKSWAPGTFYPNTAVYTDVPVPGARPGDAAMAAWETLTPGAMLISAHVPANDTVNVTVYNATPFPYLNTGTLHVTVWKKPPVS
jgi:hypothetical protein